MTLDYSSHDSVGSHCLVIDRRELVLQLEMFSPWGDPIAAEFTLEEAEEIAAAIARVCRNIRTAKNLIPVN